MNAKDKPSIKSTFHSTAKPEGEPKEWNHRDISPLEKAQIIAEAQEEATFKSLVPKP